LKTLERPGWFADLDAWWLPAVGDDVAAHVTPLGFDCQHRVHVECTGSAWKTQLQLLATPLLTKINEYLQGIEVTGFIVRPHATRVPRLVTEKWGDLLGSDLADLVVPVTLGRHGQELVTMALTPEARDEAKQRSPEILRGIRELLGEHCTISSWPGLGLQPVTVLVAASPDWHDRQAVARRHPGPEQRVCIRPGAPS
jgi:hypothetical protein